MSGPAASQPRVQAPDARGWWVRVATPGDALAVALAVAELLRDLGAPPSDAEAMEAAARTLVENEHAGAVLVAVAGDRFVGVLVANWLTAIHVPGRYGLIQDLWVDPAWRSRAIGRALLDAFFALARERHVDRVEVGIPRDAFPRIEATRSFYLRNGFEPLGARLRWKQP